MDFVCILYKLQVEFREFTSLSILKKFDLGTIAPVSFISLLSSFKANTNLNCKNDNISLLVTPTSSPLIVNEHLTPRCQATLT